jgi:integrase
MISMGRPKTLHPELPPGMTARPRKSGGFNYYYGQDKIPLGKDLSKAKFKWAELEAGGAIASPKYIDVADRWEREAIHIGRRKKTRSPKTQREFRAALKVLREAFKDFLLEQIQPKHVREYLDGRSAKISANREIAVLSVIWNWARGKGITDKANPCAGIEKNPESARERYVTNAEFDAVWAKADPALQDAMDLALATSHSPSDLLRLCRQDMADGTLLVRRGKTGKRVRFRIEGRLKTVLDRILARPRPVSSVYLIADERGQPLSIYSLNRIFRKAKGKADWQFRDLRAKAVTDEKDLRTASQRAGHADEKITAAVYRRIKGDLVSPLD